MSQTLTALHSESITFQSLQSLAFSTQKPPMLGQQVFLANTWDRIGWLLGISPRELEVIRHVFDDQTERQIAIELGISHHTVHTHLERLYEKLNVTSRVGLLLRVFETFLALQK